MVALAKRQLTLALPYHTALGREDFLVTPANKAAISLIDQWPKWPSPIVILSGPAGSGKSHLVEVWRRSSHAKCLDADSLTEEKLSPELFSDGALALEDAPGKNFSEISLFHLWNLAKQTNSFLLITTSLMLSAWPIVLPDLKSRLHAAAFVALDRPDDELLKGILIKQFLDRQLIIDEAVVNYLMNRMPRSLAMVRTLVSRIDKRALEEKAAITRNFVAKVLMELEDERSTISSE